MKIGLRNFLYMLLALCGAAFLSGCNSANTPNPDSPVELICVLEYTGSTYSPIRSTDPFNFALYDINGKFISYMDTTRLVAQRVDKMVGKCVVVRGYIVKMDGDNVLRADHIKLKK